MRRERPLTYVSCSKGIKYYSSVHNCRTRNAHGDPAARSIPRDRHQRISPISTPAKHQLRSVTSGQSGGAAINVVGRNSRRCSDRQYEMEHRRADLRNAISTLGAISWTEVSLRNHGVAASSDRGPQFTDPVFHFLLATAKLNLTGTRN